MQPGGGQKPYTCFRARGYEVHMNAQETAAYLHQGISCTYMSLTKRARDDRRGVTIGIEASSPPQEEPLIRTRLQFFRECNKRMATIAGLNNTAPLLDQEEWTAERMHDAVTAHVFDEVEEGECIGLYARNNTDVEQGRGVTVDDIRVTEPAAADPFPSLMWQPGLDILPDIILRPPDSSHASGLTRSSAWTYSGGIALAGLHFEDAYVHSINVMPALRLDLSLLDKESQDAVRLYMKLCRKRVWTFSPAHMDECDTSAHVARLFGSSSGSSGDALLVSRTAVINPKWAREQPGWTVLEQGVGDAVFADRAHSVIGLSLLNLAWNACYASFMETYVRRAMRVADRIRQEEDDPRRTRDRWDRVPRAFFLGPCVLDTALRSTSPPGGAAATAWYAPDTKRAARALLDWEERSIPADDEEHGRRRQECATAAFDDKALDHLFASGCAACQAPLVSLVYDVDDDDGTTTCFCPACGPRMGGDDVRKQAARIVRAEDVAKLRADGRTD